MALGANTSRIMVFEGDLMEPFRTRRAGFVAAHALAVTKLGQFDFGIVNVGLGRAVTCFTGQPFVLGSRQFLDDHAVAIIASFPTGPIRFAGRNFL